MEDALAALILDPNAPPRLPTELQLYILQLALPAPRFWNYAERGDLFTRFAHVNKTWLSVVEDEMLRHVYSESQEKLEESLIDAARFYGTTDAPFESLRLNWDRDDDCPFDEDAFPHARDFITSMSRLVELWPMGMMPEESDHVDLWDWAEVAPNLKSLRMFEIDFMTSRPPSNLFPRLTTLAFANFNSYSDITPILNPAALPSLIHLSFIFGARASYRASPGFLDALSAIAPQLVSFTTYEALERFHDARCSQWLDKATSLKALTVGQHKISPMYGNFLRSMPPPPATLRVAIGLNPEYSAPFNYVIKLLKSDATYISRLKRLIVIDSPKHIRNEPKQIEEVVQGFAARGISVEVDGESLASSLMYVLMEELLDPV